MTDPATLRRHEAALADASSNAKHDCDAWRACPGAGAVPADMEADRAAFAWALARVREDIARAEAPALCSEYVPLGMVEAVRPRVGEGEKLIWRSAFRWMNADGEVLPNHYEGASIVSLAADFGYVVVAHWNHIAIVRKVTP